MTKVVHCRNSPYDVYIGRPSFWENPFEIGKDGTRSEVIMKFKLWIVQQPDKMARLHELVDLTLGCWCHPKACHGHVLADLANTVSIFTLFA